MWIVALQGLDSRCSGLGGEIKCSSRGQSQVLRDIREDNHEENIWLQRHLWSHVVYFSGLHLFSWTTSLKLLTIIRTSGNHNEVLCRTRVLQKAVMLCLLSGN